MTDPTQPTVSLLIGGINYRLLFDFEAIAEAEEVADRPLLTGLRPRDLHTPTISLVRAMLFGCIHSQHPDLKYEHVKAMVNRKNLAEVWARVLDAWTSGLAEPSEDDAAADPTTDQS